MLSKLTIMMYEFDTGYKRLEVKIIRRCGYIVLYNKSTIVALFPSVFS